MILDLIDINDVYESKQKVIRMYVYICVNVVSNVVHFIMYVDH